MNKCHTCNKDTSNPKFCSKSCAAKTNNVLVPKRPKKKNTCVYCKKETNNPKYCSNACQGSYRTTLRFEQIEKRMIPPDKNYLIHLYGHFCQVCENKYWNNQLIPIEIDHINGDNTNNSLENLCLICPNCHAQTETYKAKNRGNGRHYRRERYANGQSF